MALARKPVSIDGVEFDALMDMERVLEADAPDYPVEDGFSVSDAIILKPQTISMTLMLSDMPVTWSGKHGGKGWTAQTIQRLEGLYFAEKPVTIVTTDRTYTNMAIVSISLPKDKDTGTAQQIPISFKEIRVTRAKTTTIPDSYGKSGVTGANAGTASTATSATPPASNASNGEQTQSNASILYNLANSAGLLPSR